MFESLSMSFLNEKLHKTIEKLEPKKQLIIKQRCGFDNEEPKTLEDIGRKLNITRERVRQIEAKALQKLSHPRIIETLEDYL